MEDDGDLVWLNNNMQDDLVGLNVRNNEDPDSDDMPSLASISGVSDSDCDSVRLLAVLDSDCDLDDDSDLGVVNQSCRCCKKHCCAKVRSEEARRLQDRAASNCSIMHYGGWHLLCG